MACKPVNNAQLYPKLRISENQRFLETEAGDPFFWLGDTGWLLFSKLNREEAETYFTNRKEKGFNVIQVMLIHDLRNEVNIYGDSALINQQIDKPLVTEGNSPDDSIQYDYWDHVEYLVDLANEKGLYMAMVPVWGSNVKGGHVTQQQAKEYTQWLAARFGEKSNVIWMNGGDIKGSDSTEIWNTNGQTLHELCPDQLITFHPFGRTQSSTWFQNEEWLDFNMFQSGHRRYDQDTTDLAYGEDNYKYVLADYGKAPAKPTLDGEPSYEGIPQGLHDTLQPRWTDADVRRYAYWSVFAGACGFTFGHNAIMQFHKSTDKNPAYGVKEAWHEAMNAPGASQMIYLKQLMLSVSFFDRVPAQEIIGGTNGEKYDFVIATKGNNFAFIYTCNGTNFNIDLEKLPFKNVKAQWYNPRNGEYSEIETYMIQGEVLFDPPGGKQSGNDWVLVLKPI